MNLFSRHAPGLLGRIRACGAAPWREAGLIHESKAIEVMINGAAYVV
jgi:hypothetical protein